MKVLDPKVVALLDAQDWDGIFKRLTKYAHNRMRLLYTPWGEDMLPGGVGAQDLVSDAITAVYTGRVTWNPEKHPDLLKFLMDLVKRRSGQLVELEEHKTRTFPEGVDGEQDGRLETTVQQAGHDSPELIDLKEQVQAIWNCVKEDEEDLGLVLLALSEGKKPSEIAKDLGLPVEAVNRLLEKLRRRARKEKTEEI